MEHELLTNYFQTIGITLDDINRQLDYRHIGIGSNDMRFLGYSNNDLLAVSYCYLKREENTNNV
jgi:hypothetical protein